MIPHYIVEEKVFCRYFVQGFRTTDVFKVILKTALKLMANKGLKRMNMLKIKSYERK